MFYFNDSDHLSDSTTGEDDLLDLVAQMLPVSAEWESIGIGLRLQPRLLEQIAVEHSSPRERMVRVLTQWLKTNYNTERFGLPSWRNLSNVVAHPAAGNNPALALEIARKHPGSYVYTILVLLYSVIPCSVFSAKSEVHIEENFHNV